jgi:hypothetical protein
MTYANCSETLTLLRYVLYEKYDRFGGDRDN